MGRHNKKRRNEQSELFIIILSCSGGAGHIRAAEAIHQTAEKQVLPIHTKNFDILNFTSKTFKKLYAESYIKMVNHAPALWGYLYQISEQKHYVKNPIIKIFDHLNYRHYLKTITDMNADAIICTHFLPYISISNEIRNKKSIPPIFAVTTDFDVHQLWVDPIVTRYFVHHEESAWQLHSKNVPTEKISVTGIPIMPDFKIKNHPRNIRKQLGIHPDYFTILVLSGGFGIGRIIDIVEYILLTLKNFHKRKFNLIVICGHNTRAQKILSQKKYPENVHSYIFGFVKNIHEFMDASDLLVSKAGGLTSSEAMAKNLPMLVIDPIPGQETRNSDFIVEAGAGWKAINLPNLSYKLKCIIENPKLLSKAKKSTKLLARPNAAYEILNSVYEELTGEHIL